MDDIAHASGQDPVELRLKLLDGAGENAGGDKPQNVGGAKRLANALRAAVGRSGYGAIKLGPNEGMGVACVSSQERTFPTWTACVAQVKVDPSSGEITLKKLTLAMDVGQRLLCHYRVGCDRGHKRRSEMKFQAGHRPSQLGHDISPA